MRNICKRAAVTLLMAMLAGPALALDMATATKVVELMETIADASGETVYYGGGDVFYDLDYDGQIAAAGFGSADWAIVFDEVVSGYLAIMPQNAFNAIFEDALARLDASSLTEEQKLSVRTDMEQEIGMARQARLDGAAYADAVRPLAGRLDALIFGD